MKLTPLYIIDSTVWNLKQRKLDFHKDWTLAIMCHSKTPASFLVKNLWVRLQKKGH